MTVRPLRVGVAGLGRGRMFVDLFNAIEDCRVAAVCDSSEKVLAGYEGLAAHTSYDDFLAEGLDVVAVITPGPVHAEQSVKAMDAGAHVLCETPCVYTEEEARAVVDACQRTARSFMLAEDYIWMGWAVRLKQMAEDGFVPYAGRDQHPEAQKSWRATHLPPLVYTSHTLGPLLHIMDDRIVSATGLSTGSRTAPDLGTIDLETGLFQTEKGAIVRLTNGFTVAHPYALFYNLVGTRGSAKLMRTGADLFVWYSDQEEMGGWEVAPEDWLTRPDGENHVAAMLREFVESVRNNTPTPLDVHRSLDFVLPGVTAHESALQGGPRLPVHRL